MYEIFKTFKVTHNNNDILKTEDFFFTIFSKLISLLTHHGILAETIATDFHLGRSTLGEGSLHVLIPMLILILILNHIQKTLIVIL